MTIAPPPQGIQGELFPLEIPDRKITSNGQARNEYAKVTEEVVPQILGVTPIPSTGEYDTVFDAHGNGFYYEIKSVHRSSKLPIYEWRRQKDLEAGVPLLYAVALHKVKGVTTVKDLWDQMGTSLRTILLIPHEEVSRVALEQPLRQVISARSAKIIGLTQGERMGHLRPGYREGYRSIPTRILRELAPHTVVTSEMEIRGVRFTIEVKARFY